MIQATTTLTRTEHLAASLPRLICILRVRNVDLALDFEFFARFNAWTAQ